MTSEIEEILRKALKLPPEGRAAVAGTLLDSLVSEVDEGAEAAWQQEISKRSKELELGSVRPVSWADARTTITGK